MWDGLNMKCPLTGSRVGDLAPGGKETTGGAWLEGVGHWRPYSWGLCLILNIHPRPTDCLEVSTPVYMVRVHSQVQS